MGVKDKWLQIRLTAEEKESIAKLAERCEKDNVADLIRDMVKERTAKLDKADARKKTANPKG